jgi:hypothetical protein
MFDARGHESLIPDLRKNLKCVERRFALAIGGFGVAKSRDAQS